MLIKLISYDDLPFYDLDLSAAHRCGLDLSAGRYAADLRAFAESQNRNGGLVGPISDTPSTADCQNVACRNGDFSFVAHAASEPPRHPDALTGDGSYS